jgi:hypothetical protein
MIWRVWFTLPVAHWQYSQAASFRWLALATPKPFAEHRRALRLWSGRHQGKAECRELAGAEWRL